MKFNGGRYGRTRWVRSSPRMRMSRAIASGKVEVDEIVKEVLLESSYQALSKRFEESCASK